MDRAWQRRRSPDDVPTPLAVAVSDFCRRSGYSATPAEVREALSLLSEEEDFRVRALTDGEPKSQKLSPLAVIDVLSGSAEELAAARQACGYYGLVKQLVSERERADHHAHTAHGADGLGGVSTSSGTRAQDTAAPPSVAAWSPAAAAPPVSAAAATGRSGREKKPPQQSVQERIAPTKRRPGAASEDGPGLHDELPPLAPQSSREAASPKGRYSIVAPVKESVEVLFRGEGRDLLENALEQHPDRFALTRALGESYGGRKEGQPLRTEDVERALHHHGLSEPLEHKEREAVLAAYTDQRGSAKRAANALRLSMTELHKLVKSLGLETDVDTVRERFRREALSSQRLGVRLDLLGREKYLLDLGIRRKFDERLREDLLALLRRHADKARGGRDLILVAARMEGAPAELLWRAVDKLGLTEEVKALFPDDPDGNYAP